MDTLSCHAVLKMMLRALGIPTSQCVGHVLCLISFVPSFLQWSHCFGSRLLPRRGGRRKGASSAFTGFGFVRNFCNRKQIASTYLFWFDCLPYCFQPSKGLANPGSTGINFSTFVLSMCDLVALHESSFLLALLDSWRDYLKFYTNIKLTFPVQAKAIIINLAYV